MLSGGVIDLLAGVVAGIIVLSPVGVFLALLGARWQETLLCGAGGLTLGALAAKLLGLHHAFAASVGLILGALLGGTLVALFYRLPRLIVSRLSVRS
jgi:hypothetical protein